MTEILNLLQEGIHQNEDYAPLLLKALEDQHLLQHGNVSFSFKCKQKSSRLFRFPGGIQSLYDGKSKQPVKQPINEKSSLCPPIEISAGMRFGCVE